MATPTRAFDLIIPWLLLFAFVIIAFGKAAADWLHARVTIGRRTLIAAQVLLGVYGGYFGGGVGLMTTAVYGLLAGVTPRALFAPRMMMLGIANLAAAMVFVGFGLVALGGMPADAGRRDRRRLGRREDRQAAAARARCARGRCW